LHAMFLLVFGGACRQIDNPMYRCDTARNAGDIKGFKGLRRYQS
jgi:hypothetical protein